MHKLYEHSLYDLDIYCHQINVKVISVGKIDFGTAEFVYFPRCSMKMKAESGRIPVEVLYHPYHRLTSNS